MNKIIQGDCLSVLKSRPDESVHCCVTSPPYWGLRDYGTAKWEGGDSECGHKGAPLCSSSSSLVGYSSENIKLHTFSVPMKAICSKCGAVRVDSQLGLEKSPEEYVSRMVDVFREVRRVLRKDGTLWLNLGDSYAGSWGNSGHRPELDKTPSHQRVKDTEYFERGGWDSRREVPPNQKVVGCKPKDLVGIPWMVAFALRSDGWYLRSDIIWHKPNPMPESVTDRPTKSHEYIFLLSKSERYYFDQESVGYAVTESTAQRYKSGWRGDEDRGWAGPGPQNHIKKFMDPDNEKRGWANIKTVWSINTHPYSEAHFATFPEKLIEPCVKAGCPEKGIVLDPFMGAGTTAVVARKLNRNYLGIELNPQYIDIAEKRIEKEIGLLFEGAM